MIGETSLIVYGLLISIGAISLFFGGFLLSTLISKRNLSEIEEQAASLSQERDEAKLHYESLTNNIAAAIIIRDSRGDISYCSPFTEVLTGYSRKEIYETVGDFFLTICEESDRERMARSIKVTELGGEPFQFSFQFFHKSGIKMWAETRTVPITNEEDEVVATLSVTLDITASMRYQMQVEEKNRELKEFTSMISHDLKAPIFTIRGMLQVIAEDYKNEVPSSLIELLGHIERASERLEILVTSILDYAKIGAKEVNLVPVSLSEVVNEVLADHHHLISSTDTEIRVLPLPMVLADRLMLSQVISNLIGNAIKYRMPQRKCEVTVCAEEKSTPRIVKLSVRDNGLGIPQDKIEDVFRPFIRLHGQDIEGTGIGLASVRKLVNKLGGSISLESAEGHGSTFTVTLRGVQ